MSPIESGNFSVRPDIRAAGHRSTATLTHPENGGPRRAMSDSVSVRDFYASLAIKLIQRVDERASGGVAQGRGAMFEQMVFEASAHVHAAGRFSVPPQNADPLAKAYNGASENGPSGDFWSAQAEQVIQAHLDAFSGDPFGPEATAQRIADFALSFFPLFAGDHPEMSFEEQVDAYQELVEGAIDQGFSEAMQILGALPDEISEEIERTRSLVADRLGSFFDYLRGEGAADGKKAVADGVWQDYVEKFFAQPAQ